jgi:hypothetical protein
MLLGLSLVISGHSDECPSEVSTPKPSKHYPYTHIKAIDISLENLKTQNISCSKGLVCPLCNIIRVGRLMHMETDLRCLSIRI